MNLAVTILCALAADTVRKHLPGVHEQRLHGIRSGKMAARHLRAGDVVEVGGQQLTVRRVAGPNKKDWNHTQVYFYGSTSTRVNSDTEFKLISVRKHLPGAHDQSRHGHRETERYGIKPDDDGIYHVGDDIEVAAKLIADGKRVELEQPHQVATLLDRLSALSKEAIERGEQGKVYNLCLVTVRNTNLFCQGHKNIPRVRMPQLKGVPVTGSYAATLAPDVRGEVDVTPDFLGYMESLGYDIKPDIESAAYLRATQSELNGGKVAAIAKYFTGGTLADEELVISRDNYIVDGHHRWAAQVAISYAASIDVPVKVRRIDADIGTLIYYSNSFALEAGIPQASAGSFSGMKKHLPGGHDQKSHGRRGNKDAGWLMDKDGKPLVVYRGDELEIENYDEGVEARHSPGLFFAGEKERAAYYGDVREFNLRMTRPLDLLNADTLEHRKLRGDKAAAKALRLIREELWEPYYKGTTNNESGESWTFSDLIDSIQYGNLWRDDGLGGWTMKAWQRLQEIAPAYGYDGIIVHDSGEGIGTGVSYVVYGQKQVRRAEVKKHHPGGKEHDQKRHGNRTVLDLSAKERQDLLWRLYTSGKAAGLVTDEGFSDFQLRIERGRLTLQEADDALRLSEAERDKAVRELGFRLGQIRSLPPDKYERMREALEGLAHEGRRPKSQLTRTVDLGNVPGRHRKPVRGLLDRVFARRMKVKKHTPGGKGHDQQRHGARGHCYREAWRVAIKEKADYVIGTANGVWHAWADKDGRIFEPESGNWYDNDEFVRLFAPNEKERMPWFKAAAFAAKTGKYPDPETIGIKKHTPGGKGHDQKKHGRRNWDKDGNWIGPQPKGLRVTMRPNLMDMETRDASGKVIERFSAFDSQAEQYPKEGPPGISYFKGDLGRAGHVDCLLYRNDKGKLIGILNHFPRDFPPYEKKGNVTVIVSKDHRRKGIATALVREAGKRWNIDLTKQEYSQSGFEMVAHLLGRVAKDLAVAHLAAQIVKEWQEEKHPRGKTTERTNAGSFAPSNSSPEWAESIENVPVETVTQMAEKWLGLNVTELADSPYELGFAFYLTENGEVKTTSLNRGEEAEVEIPDVPANMLNIGSLHTHIGSIGEFSDYDMDAGQSMANSTGHRYVMAVIGPNEDGDGMMMSLEIFEPEVRRVKKVMQIVKEWDESQHPRGKTTEGTNTGSFAPIVDMLTNRMLVEIKESGGFTLDARTAEDVTHGFAVGVWPTLSGHFSMDSVNVEQIERWLETVRGKVSDRRIKIGGWVNEKDGSLWLDLVRVYDRDDQDLAERIGSRMNQIAIADLDAIRRKDFDHAFINTGGTGVAKAEPSCRWLLFDGDVDAQQIMDALAEVRKAFKEWDESQHPRGKTTEASTPGSFAPSPMNLEAIKNEMEHSDVDVTPPRTSGINWSGVATVGELQVFLKKSGESEAENEVAAFEVAEILGWTDLLPACGAVTLQDGTIIIAQTVLPGGAVLQRAIGRLSTRQIVEANSPARLERLFLFEYVIGAGDRHGGNYWVADEGNRLHTIDHGLSWRDWSDAQALTLDSDLWKKDGTLERIRFSRSAVNSILDKAQRIVKAAPEGRADYVRTRLAALQKLLDDNPKGEWLDSVEALSSGEQMTWATAFKERVDRQRKDRKEHGD